MAGASAEEEERSIKVGMTSVDAFVEQSGAPLPTVVMMDIEGAEVDALRGMRRTLERSRPVILGEVHWLGEGMTACFDEVLRPLGYEMTTYSGGAVPEGYVRYHALIAPPGLSEHGGDVRGRDRSN